MSAAMKRPAGTQGVIQGRCVPPHPSSEVVRCAICMTEVEESAEEDLDGESDEEPTVQHPLLPHDRSALLWQEHRPTERLRASIRRWVTALMHDEGITGALPRGEDSVEAKVISRGSGRLAGITAANQLLLDWLPAAEWTWLVADGHDIHEGDTLLEIEADRTQLLSAERILLNIVGRLSGITTNTRKWSSRAHPMRVAATRKVHWGLLDKWAVHLGGGMTHRLTRSDARMLKENDLACLAIPDERLPHTVSRVLKELDLEECGAFVEIEVRTIDEAIAAAEAWSDRMQDIEDAQRLTLMLDNMDEGKARQVMLDLETRKFRSMIVVEASGGIGYDDLQTWKEVRVDVVSTSGLHRGAKPLDLSMLFEGS
ncbi:MAG: hypothetical protein CXX71_03855 [Methanobacteriota archaeon]|nr:MAG: hypothetical protein CXX71_03855 [Euryarchaeota archaeon]